MCLSIEKSATIIFLGTWPFVFFEKSNGFFFQHNPLKFLNGVKYFSSDVGYKNKIHIYLQIHKKARVH